MHLDSIETKNWDERVIKLYKKVEEKSPKVTMPNNKNKVLSEPRVDLLNCNYKYEKWQFVCDECNSVNQINWSKKNSAIKNKICIHFTKSF